MKKLTVLVMVLLTGLVMSGTLAAQDVVEITVRSEGFRYFPSEIRVEEGVTVRLTFENGGGGHDWVLDEFDAATEFLRGGKSETIEFVADRAGEYEFYCSVPGHRARGMVGAFIVEG